MMRGFVSYLRSFRRDDSGHASLEFAIVFPIFFILLLSAIELGVMTMRSAMLERGLDIAVREVRLSTGAAPTHAELKQRICEETLFISDCSTNLLLEMIQVDPRDWSDIPENVTCTDKSEETQPVTSFVAGLDNELMVLRACAKFEPFRPDLGFGLELRKDANGDVAIVAMSAFVQEPR